MSRRLQVAVVVLTATVALLLLGYAALDRPGSLLSVRRTIFRHSSPSPY